MSRWILQSRMAARRKLREHPRLRRVLQMFSFVYVVVLAVPAGAYAGVTAVSMTTFAEVHPTCGLVNAIRKPIENILNDVIGLVGLFPALAITALVIFFLAAETDIGRLAARFAARLGLGGLLIGALITVLLGWFATSCKG